LLAPGSDFCTSCGHPLATGPVEPDAGREERRTISVLFVDLAGFTGIGERLDPEDLRQLQLAYFATASRVVRRYGGILEKYVGDAIMAVFGVPVESEHDAVRAVAAGLDVQRELDDRPLAGRYRMRVRVGVATGEALVDLAAAYNSGEAMVSGDVVATAARLQALAPDGGVLVSATTRRATIGSIRYADPARLVTLAGKSRAAQVWLAEGLAGRVHLDDDTIPLTGRSHELDLISAALIRSVRESEARLISIVGVHGVGKSRLIREVTRRLQATPEVLVRWRVGRCLPYNECGPYTALTHIVKAQADLRDTDDEATARFRLTALLSHVVAPGDVDRLAALLGPLCGLPGRPVNPGEIESAWREVLIALARNMPTVLVVEDLHFADPAMLRFLTGLVESVGEIPLIVLCTYRPELLENEPAWAGGPPGTLTVSLGPLRGAAQRELTEGLLRQHSLPEVLTDRLCAITGGNPMYTVEYVRMLAEQAASGEVDPDVELTIPETVHGVIANRIDLLTGAQRMVLHAAAALGESVWPGAVAAMLGQPTDEVTRALGALRSRDMLVAGSTSMVAGEPELKFRHQLLRDVAYGRLPRAARANLHRRAAVWLDGLAVTGRHDLVAAQARHRVAALAVAEELGEDTSTDAIAARRTLLAAAEAAFAVYAVEPALAHLEQALTLWPPDVDQAERLATELQRRRLEFLLDGDRFYREGGAKDLVRVAERMTDIGDRAGAARAETLLGQVELMRAEQDRAAEHLSRAVALFADLPDSAAKAEAHGELARLRLLQYRPADAVTAARPARDLADRLGLTDAAANATISIAAARYLGADPAGLDELVRAVDLCRVQRLPALRRGAHNLSVLLLEEGDLPGAAEAATESVGAHGGQVSLVVRHSADATWAYYTGDWIGLLHAADAYLDADDAETTEWDLQLRGRRAWIRTLCGEPSGTDIERCRDSAARYGFARLRYNACAQAAQYHAIRGEDKAAVALLEELAGVWFSGPTTLTVEWLSAIAHTAALVPGAAGIVADVVGTVPHRTRWVDAASAMASAASAAARGDHRAAAGSWLEAAARYDAIGSVSDAVLATAWAARSGQGDPAHLARVRAFAHRNRAAGLLTLATG
jgi:class 3 adenylate cyclase